jgi:hypothetical protein
VLLEREGLGDAAVDRAAEPRLRLVGDGHTLEHAAPPQELARTARGDAVQAQARAVWDFFLFFNPF